MINPISIDFCFDIGSPDDHLAIALVPSIESRTGTIFNYIPILLGGIYKATNNRSPLEAGNGIQNKLDYECLQAQRFIKRHKGLRFTPNPFSPVNTLALMRCAVAAQFEGVFGQYLRAALHHMWIEPKKMDDSEIFRNAFISSGIDIDRLLSRSEQPDVKHRLKQNTDAAVSRGAFGSPTIFVGDEMFFGKDRLRDVEESIYAQSTDPGQDSPCH